MAKARTPRRNPTEDYERIRDAAVFAAYVVETYGDQYAPILTSLVADLEAARLTEPPNVLARRILETYTLDGGLKAIR